MKLVYPKGTTSRIVTVFIQDSASTVGAGLAGLTSASGLTGGYVREGGTGVALAVDEDVTTEGTYQAPSAAGKVRIGTPANMPAGFYELHFHNNLWASGAEAVTIGLVGTGMAPLPLEVQLSDPVRGLGAPTALPNAAADAAGGLIVSDAGGLDADAQRADVAAILVDTGTTLDGRIPAALVGGRIDASVGAMAANVVTAAAAAADLTTELQSGLATAAALATAQADLDTITGSDGVTLATAQALYAPAKAGDAMALTSGERTTLAAAIWNALTSGMTTAGSIGKKLADWTILAAADVWAVATRTLTAGTNIALAKGTGVTGFTDLSAADVRTAVGLASANLDTQLDALPTAAENATAVLTTAMTESYSTASGTKTVAQILYEIFGLVGDFSVSGTTLTVRKLDGTAATTYTLDSSSAPTSVTRAT